jgi:hypothetical protein
VEYQGLHYGTDTDSQNALACALVAYQLTCALPPVWKAKDGVLQSPTTEQLTAILTLVSGFVEMGFVKESALAERVNAAETVEDAEAVTWAE